MADVIRKFEAGELISAMVQFPSGKEVLHGYLTRPKVVGYYPGLMLLHEIFGLTDHIKAVADRLAMEGFVVLAPDLFTRESGWTEVSDMATLDARFADIPDRRILQDLRESYSYLLGIHQVKFDQSGALGFSMGGTYALMHAAQNKQVKACVSFYGRLNYKDAAPNRPQSPMEVNRTVACTPLLILGDQDAAVTPAEAEAYQTRMVQLGKACEVIVYPGAGHGFFNDTRPAYNAAAAGDAWVKTLEYLRKYLGGWKTNL